MLSEHLKKHSRPDHDSIENSIDLLKLSTNINQYTNLIKAFYGYYFHLEDNLRKFNNDFSSIGINLSERSKLHLLEDDLKKLGLDDKGIKEIKLCTDYPEMKNFSQAMGILYVLEGSTLGGQMISRQLGKSKILIDGEERGKFFMAYGPRTYEMWTNFKKSLDTLPADSTQEVLIAAKSTFNTMESWLRDRLN